MRLLNDSIVGMQAPEILERSPATMASDVYSFGLVMWEVLVWQLPWTGEPMYTVSLSVSNWQLANGNCPLSGIRAIWLVVCADPTTGHQWRPSRDPITPESARA